MKMYGEPPLCGKCRSYKGPLLPWWPTQLPGLSQNCVKERFCRKRDSHESSCNLRWRRATRAYLEISATALLRRTDHIITVCIMCRRHSVHTTHSIQLENLCRESCDCNNFSPTEKKINRTFRRYSMGANKETVWVTVIQIFGYYYVTNDVCLYGWSVVAITSRRVHGF